MKYIKITDRELFWGKDEISKDDLAQVKDRRIDAIINAQDFTFFNSEENKWEPIPHD